jgi:hypothetical protein
MIIKSGMVFLGMKERTYKDKTTGADKKSTNVKLMDYESELYDFFVSDSNTALIEDLKAGVPPMSQVDVMLEVGAYQLKPFVRLHRLQVAGGSQKGK